MKWFGRKAAGRDVARPGFGVAELARGLGGGWGGGDEGPQGYEVRVRAAYRDNPVAQRAVRMVAQGVGAAPLACPDARVRALVSATSGGQGLLECVAAQLLLHGNGYIQLLCDAGGRLCELFALRPERVTIEHDARGWPLAYAYRVGGEVTRYATDRIIHVRTMNPLDDLYGLGSLGAAAGAVATHNAATRWNRALLDNAARPSGALVYDRGSNGAVLSPVQFARLRAEIDGCFAGAANAGRPMLLEGGLSWQSLSFSPADMDFAGLKAAAARDIALAFGVPPVLLGLPGDATYANYREANRALWRQTLLPLADKILGGLAQGLAPHFPGVTLAVDLDRVSELGEDRERLWNAVSTADFLTREEKRAMLGLGAG